MLDEQFGYLFIVRAKTGKAAIVATHSAIGTVLTAKIGNFDDSTHKNFFAEILARRSGGAFMQGGLRRAVQGEFRLGWKIAMT